MFLIPQLTVLVERRNGFDLTGSKNKEILIFVKRGTTEASLIVIRFGNCYKYVSTNMMLGGVCV